MPYRGIRQKLISQVFFILLGVLIAFCMTGAITGLFIGRQQYTEIKKRVEAGLSGKGLTLVANNRIALRSLVEDNAYSAVREIVTTTVALDKDVAYGIFMDNERWPWVVAALQNTAGTGASRKPLSDPISIWADSLKGPASRAVAVTAWDVGPVIEFAAPVVSVDGRRLGTIRYGISTAQMKNAIAVQQKDAFRAAAIFFVVYLFIAVVIFFFGLSFAREQADTMTRPIESLTKAAGAITQGDYSITISAASQDEIGTLAENFDKMRRTLKTYTEDLEKMVTDRTRELKAAQKELIEKAHKAGMADIAAGTLHNVGNLLNSVKASVEAVSSVIADSPMTDFSKANRLLRENMQEIDEFIKNDARGRKLMAYYLRLEDAFLESEHSIKNNVQRLMEKVVAINDVIAAQQSYAGTGGFSEQAKLSDVIEDAITMQMGAIQRHSITVVRNYGDAPKVPVQKTKLVHIFVNLIKNAKDAMLGLPEDKRILTISVYEDAGAILACFADAGCGVAPENITKIFAHGFTTKPGGHGFGLHSSANYMKEMGGELRAESGGPGKGARFICFFPKNEGKST